MLTISPAPAAASCEAGGPGTQRSSQTVSPTRCCADVDDGRLGAGREVALLVEDPVVGQMALAIDGLDRAVGEDGGGVEHALAVGLREADDRGRARHVLRERLQRARGVAQEALAQEQVLGRVAGERELAEQHELGVGVARRLHAHRV